MNEIQDWSGGEYKFASIEAKWQAYWESHKTFKTQDDFTKPKYYILDMFPYPSGDGLHVGHPEGYTATDILARYKRMRGFNVLHPMGWDAFGLPAEQHAIKTGEHPRSRTQKNIGRFREQIKSLGLSYDWDREVDTTDAKYYKWTQWIFKRLYEKGLAYQSYEPVNWCPELGTVLANEEVIDGKSEVGGFPVIKKPMRQWVLKITAYAERLLEDLDGLAWPEGIKEMQRNWIGKSIGASVVFKIENSTETFEVFTTRPDTLFGATFCVLAPEHAAIKKITTASQKKAVDDYIIQAGAKSDLERTSLSKDKSGVFTGAYAVNPVNMEKIPIWIADYVLISYGTGAIMAVPGHDERDHEFAKKFKLPIKRVLSGGKEEDITVAAHAGDGKLVNSDFLNGLEKQKAIDSMCSWLEKNGSGKKTVTYKLRDWLFSRQRYWGEPFPLAHDKDGNVVLIDDKELPVMLPEMEDFKPTGNGEPPLAKAEAWLKIERNCKQLTRETNTMPQWAGSCWYYLRYIDPGNSDAAWSKEKEKYWMPVDLYVGGIEHAVLHLLYARFWHKVLYDIGEVSTKEPFQRLVNQGMILGENGEKMSKSRGNVVNPDDIIRDWGADSLRLYEMFMGPLEAVKPWQTTNITGVHRFLKRFQKLIYDEHGKLQERFVSTPSSESFKKTLHKAIKKVTDDTENLQFNTAISAMMELVNTAYKEPAINKADAEAMTLLLAPYAPHLAEEVWEKFGHKTTLAYYPWPKFDSSLVTEDTVTLSIQINGKLRGTLVVDKGAAKEDIIAQAKNSEGVEKHLEGKEIVKEIFVPGKIVSFVVK